MLEATLRNFSCAPDIREGPRNCYTHLQSASCGTRRTRCASAVAHRARVLFRSNDSGTLDADFSASERIPDVAPKRLQKSLESP
jgi:hypothetical protein